MESSPVPKQRFGKRADVIVHEEDPLNAETPRVALAASAVTALDAFYVRSHGPVPELAGDRWMLRVGGLVDRPVELSLTELRDGRHPVHEVAATLQCAGNRRAGLTAVAEIPGEAPWGPGAIGTAVWRGVALGDVLRSAGPAPSATDVAFVGVDRSEEADPPQPFGASIPLRKAMGPEVLLAWEMNGEPLPPVHGAPLRVIVPGYIGARSVKWLERIELRDAPFDGFFQETVYRLVAPDREAGPGIGMALGEVALNADFLLPADGERLPAGSVELRGWAFAGGDRQVERVDVSLDHGTTWRQADLMEDLGRWAWRRWRAHVDLAPGDHEIVVRAWDSAAATQPEDPAHLWNPKGYVNNSWGRVRVHAEA